MVKNISMQIYNVKQNLSTLTTERSMLETNLQNTYYSMSENEINNRKSLIENVSSLESHIKFKLSNQNCLNCNNIEFCGSRCDESLIKDLIK